MELKNFNEKFILVSIYMQSLKLSNFFLELNSLFLR